MSNRSSGFTLIELLLAVTLAVIVVGLAMVFVFQSREVFTLDRARTNANQNLRSGLDIIMADVRQAGERLGTDIPAVQVTSGATDTLTLRRNLIDAVLPVCVDLAAGSGSSVTVAMTGTSDNAECKTPTDPGTTTAITAWKDYIAAQGSTPVRAFLYDPGDPNSHEFFVIDAIDTTSNITVSRDGGTWVGSYAANSRPRLYLMEERSYTLDAAAHMLQLSANGGSPQNVVADVTGFEVEAYQKPISAPKLFNADGSYDGTAWQAKTTGLAFVKVTLTAQDRSRREVLERTLSDQATPRNVLSSTGGF